MKRNRPRIITTNKRMEGGIFVHSLSIRGWSLEVANVDALRELQSASGAPKGVLREGVAPVLWAPLGVDIVLERSELDAVHVRPYKVP